MKGGSESDALMLESPGEQEDEDTEERRHTTGQSSKARRTSAVVEEVGHSYMARQISEEARLLMLLFDSLSLTANRI